MATNTAVAIRQLRAVEQQAAAAPNSLAKLLAQDAPPKSKNKKSITAGASMLAGKIAGARSRYGK